MSNALAIAAVTATLRRLLTNGVPVITDLADTNVTTISPDTARASGTTHNQINLFLYQAVPNAAWRNGEMPGIGRSGETAAPPLALNLYYLLTTYGRDNDIARPFSHELLGRAMSILHDHPLLGAEEIALSLPGNDLGQQIERIRFSLQPLNVEEIYRLWAGFQTPYRTSVAYEASVVLIESTREAKTALPVTRRGATDSGVSSQANIASPFARIVSVAPSVDVTFGDTLTITGSRLSGGSVSVEFSSPRLAQPRSVPVLPGASDSTVSVLVPIDPAFPAGLYSVSVRIVSTLPTGETEKRSSNEVAVSLAPKLTSGVPATVSAVEGKVSLSLGCAPAVVEGQRVSLLFGDREIIADVAARPATSLNFTILNAAAGAYFVRLRVDGADSTMLVDRAAKPATFDPARKVTVT